MKTADAARGKWRGILMAFGIDRRFLQNKHGPCPMCGGDDRYRFDDRDGGGGFICNQCGAGDGFKLLMQIKGWSFVDAAKEVDRIVGNIQAETPKRELSEQRAKELMADLWGKTTKLTGDDPASRYLAGRGCLPTSLPLCLRYASRCPIPGGSYGPAMIALVTGVDGVNVNLHRTFLGPNGKADMDAPRATFKGTLPAGSAVRLFPVFGARLGIAEGIETALAASRRFAIPVWAALNSAMLAKWEVPAGVEEVVIFGDCDPAFGGQASAYALAHRIATRHRIAVDVRIPKQVGRDWADADVA